MEEDDSDDIEEEIESLMEGLAQILHFFNKLLGFLLGDGLVKLFYAAAMVLGLFIAIRFYLRHCKNTNVPKSLKESDNGDSLDLSFASNGRKFELVC